MLYRQNWAHMYIVRERERPILSISTVADAMPWCHVTCTDDDIAGSGNKCWGVWVKRKSRKGLACGLCWLWGLSRSLENLIGWGIRLDSTIVSTLEPKTQSYVEVICFITSLHQQIRVILGQSCFWPISLTLLQDDLLMSPRFFYESLGMQWHRIEPG